MSNTQVLADSSVTSKVLQALENSEFVWRTIPGIEKDTQLSPEQIATTLHLLPQDTLLVASGRDGKKLYSTREHWRKTQSIWGKLLSALSDTVK